jgi:hypothetical protein
LEGLVFGVFILVLFHAFITFTTPFLTRQVVG